MVLLLGDSTDELMDTSGGVLKCLRLAVLVRRISDNERVLADVDTNVSHNNSEFKQYATSKHLGAIIANAGSKPSELSGFGC